MKRITYILDKLKDLYIFMDKKEAVADLESSKEVATKADLAERETLTFPLF